MRNFSSWKCWNERNNLRGIEYPGIYCIAVTEEDISGQPFNWIDKINYIGMTNSKSGLKGRLKQFDNTIKGKTGHGGADRFLYKYRNYNEVLNQLFVSVKYFECDVESNSPNDLLIMGDVVKHEYECFAEFVKAYGQLPTFNRKSDADKYSLTVGRGKE